VDLLSFFVQKGQGSSKLGSSRVSFVSCEPVNDICLQDGPKGFTSLSVLDFGQKCIYRLSCSDVKTDWPSECVVQINGAFSQYVIWGNGKDKTPIEAAYAR